ncbi:MAG: hypothetical protein U5L00_02740 [Desulfovermiculus sp.]|nr:hypothetical protein [Desulfovermiculus sp.]
MSGDELKKCLAWSELLENGQAGFSRVYTPLIEAGLASSQGKQITLLDANALQDIVDNQCRTVIQARDEAQDLARSLGLEVTISSRPKEALELLMELQAHGAKDSSTLQIQNLSAKLFGHSKHIQQAPLLSRIMAQWSRSRHVRGELRLKAFAPLIYLPQDLDLGLVTSALGQVCIPAPKAVLVQDFDLDRIDFVVTSENLAPFQHIELDQGLLLLCPGYDTALSVYWLKALPRDCPWMHFGDFDPDGLAIFELLSSRSGRRGRFVPHISHLEHIKNRLPTWLGAREFDPQRYTLPRVRELAAWGRANRVYAEQEQVLHLLGWEGVLEM